MADEAPSLFAGLADFEIEFFTNLVRCYSRLDVGMRGFFFHRMRQVIAEAIDLLRADLADPPRGRH
jgi:hypothetical protein